MAGAVEARRLMRLCIKYRLDGLEFLAKFRLTRLGENYNGIGPEWLGDLGRKLVSLWTGVLEPMAFVHDNRFAESDGSWRAYDEANEELLRNGYKIANARYGWYDPRRYILRSRVRLFYELCKDFGWKAYREAYHKRFMSNQKGEVK